MGMCSKFLQAIFGRISADLTQVKRGLGSWNIVQKNLPRTQDKVRDGTLPETHGGQSGETEDTCNGGFRTEEGHKGDTVSRKIAYSFPP